MINRDEILREIKPFVLRWIDGSRSSKPAAPSSDNTVLTLKESATPATPASGNLSIFAGTDSWPRAVNDVGKNIPLGVGEISLPLTGWRGSGAVLSVSVGANEQWVFRNAQNDYIDTAVFMPPGWRGRNIYIDLMWFANTGGLNVAWIGYLYYQVAGGALQSSANIWSNNIQSAANVIELGTISLGVLNPTSDVASMAIRVMRAGSDATDTFAGDAYLLAVRLRAL